MWLRGGGLSGCLVLKLVAWMLIFEITVIIVTVTFVVFTDFILLSKSSSNV